jgi:hypothetical protein
MVMENAKRRPRKAKGNEGVESAGGGEGGSSDAEFGVLSSDGGEGD